MPRSFLALVIAAGCGTPHGVQAGAEDTGSVAEPDPLQLPDVGGRDVVEGEDEEDTFVPPDVEAPVVLDPGSYPLWLEAGAFPPVEEHPNALVVVPPGFDATPPFGVVVYIHGHHNCVENIVRDEGEPCTPGGPVRNAYKLATQLAASGKRTLLLCPEVRFDEASSDPGTLADPGALAALLAEALAALDPRLQVADVTPVVVASHSGGYQAAAGIATKGGVPVSEVWLLDSLYGSISAYEDWIASDLDSFDTQARRFADVYTDGGGTLGHSQDLADLVATWVPASALVDDRTSSTWPETTYHHGLLFKRSELSHDGVPRYYFGQLLQTSGLP